MAHGEVTANGIHYMNTKRSDGTVLLGQEYHDNLQGNGGTYRPQRYEGLFMGDPGRWVVISPSGTENAMHPLTGRALHSSQETQDYVDQLNRQHGL